MLRAGALRAQLASTLRAAYADGLLSEGTFSYRLDLLLSSRVIDPGRVVGDLNLRSPTRRWTHVGTALRRQLDAAVLSAGGLLLSERREPPVLLALDWDSGQAELLIGRHPDCDILLSGPTVSRHHARLYFRDGRWILRDLDSTNGTIVNRGAVGRCELRPGDRVLIGSQELLID
jgi:hypothetical protein